MSKFTDWTKRKWEYAKEHPVKTAAILLGTGAGIFGLGCAIKNHNSNDEDDLPVEKLGDGLYRDQDGNLYQIKCADIEKTEPEEQETTEE